MLPQRRHSHPVFGTRYEPKTTSAMRIKITASAKPPRTARKTLSAPSAARRPERDPRRRSLRLPGLQRLFMLPARY